MNRGTALLVLALHGALPGALLPGFLPGFLNLNTATSEELDTLPGIGPVLAGRIVEFREKRGGFRRIEELLAIEGISERLWQELKPRVVVGEDGEDGTSETTGDQNRLPSARPIP